MNKIRKYPKPEIVVIDFISRNGLMIGGDPNGSTNEVLGNAATTKTWDDDEDSNSNDVVWDDDE